MRQTPWFERTFEPITDNGRLPGIIERLRSISLRIRDKLDRKTDSQLSIGPSGKWSVKEEIGHLLTLEPLWLGRIEDLTEGKAYLREADLTNRATFEGGFNDRDALQLCSALEAKRSKMITMLQALEDSDLFRSSLHPRLLQPMRIIDLTYFIAEHDDHHLVRIQSLFEQLG